jgi:hypothetical protein
MDDTMVPMFIFRLLDVDNSEYLEADTLIYLVFAMYGKNAERNNDARLIISRLRDMQDARIDKELYTNLLHAYPSLLKPLWELKDGFTKTICGTRFWGKYRDWRLNKIFEKIENESYELSDYYLDDSCVIRFFDLCGGEFPPLLQARLDNLKAKHAAEIALQDPEELKRLRKQARKLEPPPSAYSADVLSIMRPVATRLTFNVDKISGNKFARALAFGKNYEQTRNHNGAVVPHTNEKKGKAKHVSDKEKVKGDQKDQKDPEEGIKDSNHQNHHHHHHHHHHHGGGDDKHSPESGKERGISFDEEVVTKPLHHGGSHDETHKPAEVAEERAMKVDRPGGGGLIRKLSALVGLEVKGHGTEKSFDKAVKTKHDRFGDATRKAKSKKEESHKNGDSGKQQAKAAPKDELDEILQRKQRPEPPPLDELEDMPNFSPGLPKRKKSMIQRISSFAFYKINTKHGVSKPKKYKIAPENAAET